VTYYFAFLGVKSETRNYGTISTMITDIGYKPSETHKWTYGFHRYSAKFIAQLVEKLVEDYLEVVSIRLLRKHSTTFCENP